MALTPENIAEICARVMQQMSSRFKVKKFEPFDPLNESFPIYIEKFTNYCSRNGLTDATDVNGLDRGRLLLDSFSTDTYNLLARLTAPEPPNGRPFHEIVQILAPHLNPRPNTFGQQLKFLSMYQDDDEQISEFVTRLKLESTNSQFVCPRAKCGQSISEIFLKCQFVRGLRDSQIREKLMQLGAAADNVDQVFSFEEIVSYAMSIEMTQAEYNGPSTDENISTTTQPEAGSRLHFGKGNNKSSGQLQKNYNKHRATQSSPYRLQFQKKKNKMSDSTLYQSLGINNLCVHCGQSDHTTKTCTFSRESLKCDSCNKNGHVSKVCISTLIKYRNMSNNNNALDSNNVGHDTNKTPSLRQLTLVQQSSELFFS